LRETSSKALARNVRRRSKKTMKTLLCILGILAGMSVIGTPAHAQNYTKDSGANCDFATFEQCPAYVGGSGGLREPDTLNQPRTLSAPALILTEIEILRPSA
jgi:hypothetical protein